MIAKQERTQSSAYQNKDQTQGPKHQRWYIEQRINKHNHRLKDSSQSHLGFKYILLAPKIFAQEYVVVKTQKMVSSHGGFLTNAMHRHREST